MATSRPASRRRRPHRKAVRIVTPDNRFLGEAIREAREAAAMTQAELGRRTATDSGHMTLIEQGKTAVPWPRLRAIGEAVGVPGWELLRRAEESRTRNN